jgi:hypothetical protein
MVQMDDFSEIGDPPCSATMLTAAQVQSGPPIDPIARIATYSSDEWESFIDEWVSSLKKEYKNVLRFTGAGDKGIDIAGFKDVKLLQGIWDNYQCKHYSKPLSASDILPEIGKILWYSFQEDYAPPRACYFVAPKQTSTSLTHLLANADKLKARVIASWDDSVRDKIMATPVPMTGPFATYVKALTSQSFDPCRCAKWSKVIEKRLTSWLASAVAYRPAQSPKNRPRNRVRMKCVMSVTFLTPMLITSTSKASPSLTSPNGLH